MTLVAVKKSVKTSKQEKNEAFETIDENQAHPIVTSNRWSLDYRQEDQTERPHVEVDQERHQ
jgi:hypothetical protein